MQYENTKLDLDTGRILKYVSANFTDDRLEQISKLHIEPPEDFKTKDLFIEHKSAIYVNPPKKNTRPKAKRRDLKIETHTCSNELNKLILDSKFQQVPFNKLHKPPLNRDLYKCKTGYVMGQNTSKSVTYYKQLTCGHEYCECCGQDYSLVHNRRIVRTSEKIMQFNKWGYFVFTIPEQARKKSLEYGKTFLSDFRTYIRRMFKSGITITLESGTKQTYLQNSKGLFRWHYCGDDYKTWNPHLNVLLNTGYLNPKVIQEIKRRVTLWMNRYFMLENAINQSVIYYSYASRSKKEVWKAKHYLKYILRPTAKYVTDYRIRDVLYYFNNTSYMGKFKKIEKRSCTSSIQFGKCIYTGEKIEWFDFIKPSQFKLLTFDNVNHLYTCKRKTDPDKPPEISIRVLNENPELCGYFSTIQNLDILQTKLVFNE